VVSHRGPASAHHSLLSLRFGGEMDDYLDDSDDMGDEDDDDDLDVSPHDLHEIASS
jgi:hypothetical protein